MENERKQKGKVRITSMITLLMCLIDIYIIINFPEDYIILAGGVFITLLFAVFSLNSWFKWNDLQGQLRNEQYSDIMNVQKSSYVIVQKKLQDIDDKINFVGQKIMPLEKAGDVHQRKIASILDSIVEDQKKIAKITISRSKENADALMNSNDKLLLQMEEFRDSIAGMQQQLLSQQGEIHSKNSDELGKSRSEIIGRITELKELLEKEAGEISENILNSQQSLEESYSNAIETAAVIKNNNSAVKDVEESMEPVEVQQTVPASIDEPLSPAEDLPAMGQTKLEQPSIMIENLPVSDPIEESPIPAEDVSITEPSLQEEQPLPELVEEQAGVTENLPVEELAAPAEDVSIVEPSLQEEQPLPELTEEQAEAAESLPMEESLVPAEDVSITEPSLQIEQPLPEPAEKQAEAIEKLPEPNVAKDQPEPAKESAVPSSDSKMSPEDIAALIAKTVAEELPETTEKFQEEEKPPVPDMSDPNRPMSPEDIAALIANM